jgi:hypothetical protein
MSLATCPHCGTIFATKEGGCPTCTYRLPPEMVPHSHLHPAAAVVERTQQLIHHLVDKVYEVLPHHHHPR